MAVSRCVRAGLSNPRWRRERPVATGLWLIKTLTKGDAHTFNASWTASPVETGIALSKVAVKVPFSAIVASAEQQLTSRDESDWAELPLPLPGENVTAAGRPLAVGARSTTTVLPEDRKTAGETGADGLGLAGTVGVPGVVLGGTRAGLLPR